MEHAAPAHDRAEPRDVEAFFGENVHDGFASEFVLGSDRGEILEFIR